MRRQHKQRGFKLRFLRQGNMNRHLITIKVSIERCTDKRMNLNSLAFYQKGLECLNTKTVQSWRPVQKNRPAINNFFKYIPDNRILPVNKFFGGFDRFCNTTIHKTANHKWLKELNSHAFRQTTLMKFQFRTNNDHRTPGIINSLS